MNDVFPLTLLAPSIFKPEVWFPTGKSSYKFITSDQVHHLKSSFEIYFEPFSLSLWLLTLGFLILSGLIINMSDENFRKSRFHSLLNFLPPVSWISRILVEQNYKDSPNTFVKEDLTRGTEKAQKLCKIVLCFWLFYGLLLMRCTRRD